MRYSRAMFLLILSSLLMTLMIVSACATEEVEQAETVIIEEEAAVEVEEEVPEPAVIDEAAEAEVIEPDTPGLTATVIDEAVLRATDFIGTRIINPEGEPIGQVSDLMIGYPSAQVSYVALSLEGLEGVGNELYAVPMSALFIDRVNDRIIFNRIEPEALAQIPSFEPDLWPDMTLAGWDESFREYWQGPVQEEPAVRASELIGDAVINPREEVELGTVENLLIGLTSYQAKYVTLASPLEDELTPFPFYLLRLAPEEDRAVTYVSPIFLAEAPDFAADGWPPLDDPQWDNPYLAYWGSEVNPTAAALLAGPIVGDDGLSLEGLLDYDIESPQGEELGEIEEILINLETQRVLYTVMEVEEFLDFSERLFPVPLDYMELSPGENAMILNMTEEELETAPGFDASQWPNVTDPQWRTYWGNRMGETEAGETTLAETVVRTTELLNYDVENPQDEDLGEIEDVIVSMEDSSVKYLLLSFEGGLFDTQEKYFPLPLSALTIDHSAQTIILDIDEATLENAPGLDPADWPANATIEWEASVNDYWENLTN